MPNTKPGETPKTNFLRPNALRELEYDAQQCRGQLSETSVHGQVTNKQAVAKRLRNIEGLIEKDRPKPVSDIEQNSLRQRQVELEAQIKDGMLSHDEMMRNPPGAVGQNIKHTRQTKPAQLEWKANQLRLNHDSDDPDIANVERLRPRTAHLGMDGAQIPGRMVSTPSAAYMANYGEIDFTTGPAAEALDKAIEKRLGDMTAQDLATPTGHTSAAAKKGKKGGKGWSPERRQAASEAWHARQEAKKVLESPEAQATE